MLHTPKTEHILTTHPLLMKVTTRTGCSKIPQFTPIDIFAASTVAYGTSPAQDHAGYSGKGKGKAELPPKSKSKGHKETTKERYSLSKRPHRSKTVRSHAEGYADDPVAAAGAAQVPASYHDPFYQKPPVSSPPDYATPTAPNPADGPVPYDTYYGAKPSASPSDLGTTFSYTSATDQTTYDTSRVAPS